MKRIILRIENLLLIIPGVLALGEVILMRDSVFDLHLHDTYFVIAHFNIWIFFFVLNLVPFCCHLLLRMQYKANKGLPIIHVLITSILLVCFLIFSMNKIGEPRRYYDLSYWESPGQLVGPINDLIITFSIFIIIHLLFILYTIIKLLSIKASPKI